MLIKKKMETLKILTQTIHSFSSRNRYKKNMNIRIEPTFRIGVLSIINAPIKGYLYNAGLKNISYYFGS